MQYNAPYGVSDPNAPYINGNPSTGTMGSIPPAASIEYPQREIVNMITDAGIEVPSNAQLHQLARAIQSGKLNYAEDTGTANAYACNLTPPPLAIYEGLEVVLEIANANNGPSVLNVNNLGNNNIVRYDGTPFAGAELKPGMLACFRFDGTNWRMSWPTTYTGGTGGLVYLTAPRDYYVNGTMGSDTLNGLQATVGSDGTSGPYKTIQKAFNQTELFNLNGFAINVHIADGTYNPPGPCSMPQMNGSGIINVIGNAASPQNVVIAPVMGSGMIFSSCNATINGFSFSTVQNTSDPSDISACIWVVGGNVTVDAARFGNCYSSHITGSGPGFIGVNGPITVYGGAAAAHLRADAGAIVALNPINKPVLTLLGPPLWNSGFAVATDLSVIRGVYASITGTAGGSKFYGTTNSIFNTGGAGVSYFPGNTAGVLTSGAQFI